MQSKKKYRQRRSKKLSNNKKTNVLQAESITQGRNVKRDNKTAKNTSLGHTPSSQKVSFLYTVLVSVLWSCYHHINFKHNLVRCLWPFWIMLKNKRSSGRASNRASDRAGPYRRHGPKWFWSQGGAWRWILQVSLENLKTFLLILRFILFKKISSQHKIIKGHVYLLDSSVSGKDSKHDQ